jgi:serine-type D-Ala-D-Ala carboxypeptidase (penicillin-binding protein 5/6)
MKRKIISLAFLFMFVVCLMTGKSFVMAKPTVANVDFNAKAYYLMDYATGEPLLEGNAEQKLPVASIVKLMTIDIVCREIETGSLSLDEKIIVSENASSMGGSQVFIETNGEYSVADMLKSVIVSSANDASVALAEKIAGSEEEFVNMMNARAKELGLEGTNYVNCTGLPAPNQFSCAKDTAMLLKEVCSHDIYHKFSTIWMDTLSHPKGRESELVNTNKLIRYYEGCDGGKTGSTSEAGYCLSATAKRGNMRLIGVVLGAENGKARFSETSKLLNYGFANFETKKVVDSDSFEIEVDTFGGKEQKATAKAKEDIVVLCKKRENSSEVCVETKVDRISAPMKAGDKVGTIYVTKNGIVVGESELLLTQDIERANMVDGIQKIVEYWKIL